MQTVSAVSRERQRFRTLGGDAARHAIARGSMLYSVRATRCFVTLCVVVSTAGGVYLPVPGITLG
jgi:hypothetical protein